MPTGVIFHEGNALALGGLDDDSGGLALDGACVVECFLDLVEVVAVDLLHVEAECSQLVHDGVGAHNVGDVAVDLQAVVVDDDAEVVQLVVGANMQASQTWPS